MSPKDLLIEEPSAKKMKLDTKCVLRFAKLTEHAYAPVRGSERAAGLDLMSAYDIDVPARGKAIVKTDLQVQVPEGSYGRVAPRSGLAVKNFIDVGAGVVDEDYRGNLGVVLFNHSDEVFTVKRGDRVAQFICERIFYPEVEQVEKLSETARGSGGFGSTGVKELPTKDTANGVEKQDAAKNGVEKMDAASNGDEKKEGSETKGATTDDGAETKEVVATKTDEKKEAAKGVEKMETSDGEKKDAAEAKLAEVAAPQAVA